MPRYSWLAAVLLAGTVACSSGDDATPAAGTATADAPAGTGDDVADIAAYELTMDKVDRLFAAQRNIALAMNDMPQAERDALEGADLSEASLEEFGERLESIPAVEDALEDAGISGREYATATMAMVSAGMAASVLQMRPDDDADSLAREMNANMDNIRFIQEHEAEITQKQQALEAELRGMGALDEE